MTHTLKQLARQLGPTVKTNQPLGIYTTFKVGGNADLYFEALTVQQLQDSIQAARALNIPVTVLGGGSNVLIGDKGIRGLVIKNRTKEISVRGMKGSYSQGEPTGVVYVEAESGVIFNSFVRFTIEEGYGGIEMHLGLPGTVGGAVFMNSKWTKPTGYVGDVLYQGTILTRQGEMKIVPKDYFHFAYDTSILQTSGDILLSATFIFNRVPKEELWARANESIRYRRESQPQGVQTPGCTFQNISTSEALRLPTPQHIPID